MKKTTFIGVLLLGTLLAACDNKSRIHSGEESLTAKHLFQGIWLEEGTDYPILQVKGDSIYYYDTNSLPVAFKIIQDSLYLMAGDTSRYHIDRQSEHTFWFHAQADDVVKLYKSDEESNTVWNNLSANAASKPLEKSISTDSVVEFKGVRYRAYTYIHPTRKKVLRSMVNDEGMQIEQVYYDNVMHICVYEGKRCLYDSDIKKQDFGHLFSKEQIEGSILADMVFLGVNKDGFHYQTVLTVPESYVGHLIDLYVSTEGKLTSKLGEH